MGVSRSNVIAPCRRRGRIGTKPDRREKSRRGDPTGRQMGNGVENEEIEENDRLPSGTEFRPGEAAEGTSSRPNRFWTKNLNAVQREPLLRFRQPIVPTSIPKSAFCAKQ